MSYSFVNHHALRLFSISLLKTRINLRKIHHLLLPACRYLSYSHETFNFC